MARHTIIVLTTLVVSIGPVELARADELHVPGDYPTIQDAIDHTTTGDEIVLAEGEYYESPNFIGAAGNITVRSTNPEDPDVVAATVVLPDQLIVLNSQNPAIDGLTFASPTGEYSRACLVVSEATITRCEFIGVGIWVLSGDATIEDCTFRDIHASAQNGGGLLMTGNDPWVRMERCRFIDNRIDVGAGAAFAVVGITGSLYANECEFLRNTVGEALDISGGNGIGGACGVVAYTFPSEPTMDVKIHNCRFVGNQAEQWSAAVAASALAIGWGGADEDDLHAEVVNCTFVGNLGGEVTVAVGGGPADSNTSRLVNCTLVANEAAFATAYVLRTGTEFPVSNCISRGNTSGLNLFAFRPVSHNNLDGVSDTDGEVAVIDADPLFVRAPDPGPDDVWGTLDDDYGDLRLQSGSPSADAANNDYVVSDFFDLDGDGDTDEPLPYDLDGNPRFVEDPGADDCWQEPGSCGRAPIVDMGAYELQPGALCTWDLDGDDVVGTGDLIHLLGSWGDPYGTADLIELLGNWGPCPK